MVGSQANSNGSNTQHHEAAYCTMDCVTYCSGNTQQVARFSIGRRIQDIESSQPELFQTQHTCKESSQAILKKDSSTALKTHITVSTQ
jgi:hypothetical protein